MTDLNLNFTNNEKNDREKHLQERIIGLITKVYPKPNKDQYRLYQALQVKQIYMFQKFGNLYGTNPLNGQSLLPDLIPTNERNITYSQLQKYQRQERNKILNNDQIKRKIRSNQNKSKVFNLDGPKLQEILKEEYLNSEDVKQFFNIYSDKNDNYKMWMALSINQKRTQQIIAQKAKKHGQNFNFQRMMLRYNISQDDVQQGKLPLVVFNSMIQSWLKLGLGLINYRNYSVFGAYLTQDKYKNCLLSIIRVVYRQLQKYVILVCKQNFRKLSHPTYSKLQTPLLRYDQFFQDPIPRIFRTIVSLVYGIGQQQRIKRGQVLYVLYKFRNKLMERQLKCGGAINNKSKIYFNQRIQDRYILSRYYKYEIQCNDYVLSADQLVDINLKDYIKFYDYDILDYDKNSSNQRYIIKWDDEFKLYLLRLIMKIKSQSQAINHMKDKEPLLTTHSKYFLRNFHIVYRQVIKQVIKFYYNYLNRKRVVQISFNQYKFLKMNGKQKQVVLERVQMSDARMLIIDFYLNNVHKGAYKRLSQTDRKLLHQIQQYNQIYLNQIVEASIQTMESKQYLGGILLEPQEQRNYTYTIRGDIYSKTPKVVPKNNDPIYIQDTKVFQTMPNIITSHYMRDQYFDEFQIDHHNMRKPISKFQHNNNKNQVKTLAQKNTNGPIIISIDSSSDEAQQQQILPQININFITPKIVKKRRQLDWVSYSQNSEYFDQTLLNYIVQSLVEKIKIYQLQSTYQLDDQTVCQIFELYIYCKGVKKCSQLFKRQLSQFKTYAFKAFCKVLRFVQYHFVSLCQKNNKTQLSLNQMRFLTLSQIQKRSLFMKKQPYFLHFQYMICDYYITNIRNPSFKRPEYINHPQKYLTYIICQLTNVNQSRIDSQVNSQSIMAKTQGEVDQENKLFNIAVVYGQTWKAEEHARERKAFPKVQFEEDGQTIIAHQNLSFQQKIKKSQTQYLQKIKAMHKDQSQINPQQNQRAEQQFANDLQQNRNRSYIYSSSDSSSQQEQNFNQNQIYEINISQQWDSHQTKINQEKQDKANKQIGQSSLNKSECRSQSTQQNLIKELLQIKQEQLESDGERDQNMTRIQLPQMQKFLIQTKQQVQVDALNLSQLYELLQSKTLVAKN